MLFYLLFISAGFFIYLYVRKNYNHWADRNIPYLEASFPFGNYKKLILQRASMGEAFQEIYRGAQTPLVGTFLLLKPILVICDYKLANRILVKDFNYFYDRHVYSNPEKDPLSANLFGLKGDKWKSLRGKLAPAFTAIKLKTMFPLIAECGEHLVNFLIEKSKTGESFEARVLAAQYTIDSIASIAFGHQINTVDNPNNEFQLVASKFFAPTLRNSVRNTLAFLYPWLSEFLGIRLLDRSAEDFFVSLVKEKIEERETNKIIRKDFVQSLLDLRNTGKIDDSENSEFRSSKVKLLSVEEIAAHAFLFFSAGFETASTTMSFTLYELAKNQDIQRKVMEEIDQVFKNEVELTYENYSELKYLDACINETLRKYTPLSFLNRCCTIPYKIPNTDLVIEKGVSVVIPVGAFHLDEKLYPDPYEFRPSRFLDETKDDHYYIPFGEGPRMCVGPKVGFVQAKVGLITVLRDFKCTLSNDMSKEPKLDPTSFITKFQNGIHLKVEKRNRI